MSGAGGACFDFAKGKCNRDNCRFSHDQPLEERKAAECFDFKRGQCTRGETCRFSHGEEASGLQDVLENPDYQPFTCTVCEIEINYDYQGRKPPYARNISFLEDGYFRRDPFSVDPHPLFLGGLCSVCGVPVCAALTCSFFYAKRFCLPCGSDNIVAFPVEIQQDIKRNSQPANATSA
mmetsp:Transcript_7584/g.15413  ORF Transcript_7584/g.15413 Transcript_7584/m.15413 type:complete len:178 (-) Transcript_7584:165-698(-)|eukprot:CAMPEP_0118928492 /NCGR_PEP_ID=MMETSP1169-20130426/5725_1 /TAXON_ID=36882 /ORGANISM="Pyramimonas obovata, Strain CCMP722" /LENGTH=177 /DNA_ID=CAMNT_0006870471 /DNA_START=301 /DNA_END=834 /DNA_ORIENTATION=-